VVSGIFMQELMDYGDGTPWPPLLYSVWMKSFEKYSDVPKHSLRTSEGRHGY
jgi:hypothetical protein